MMTATECPTPKELRELALGRLSDELSDELFQHVSTCDECRGHLETVEDAGDSLVEALLEADSQRRFESEPDCRVAVAKAVDVLGRTGGAEAEDEVELPGTIGEYDIVRPLGRGGMGSVYLARHNKLGREVALKLLATHRLADTRMHRRFEAEMRAIGRLSHPNIVAAHDAREVDGTAVLVTEFIDGLDLEQVVGRVGTLSLADACEITRQVAVALEYTNSQGFVHRDVKPSNIMLSAAGEVKLLDLGLARLQYGDNDRSEITGAGQAMGTADYVAPEQVSDCRNVDVRADIYSLGCTLFKLLTGQPPFADAQYATAFAKMTAHVSTAPPRLSQLRSDAPQGLVELVDSMLAKNPDARPESPRIVAQKLEQFCIGSELLELASRANSLPPLPVTPTRSTAKTSAPPGRPFFQRSVPVGVAMAAGLLGLLVGLWLGIIITITHPDGTKTVIQPPAGSGISIRDDAVSTAGKTTAPTNLPGDVPRNELQAQLQGIWRAVDISGNGPKTAFGEKVYLMAFTEDNFYLADSDGLEGSGTYSVRSGVGGDPYHKIDFVDQLKGGSMKLGIFQFLAEGKLQLCLNERLTLERPTRFASERNSASNSLVTLERIAPNLQEMPFSAREARDPEKEPLLRAFAQIQVAAQPRASVFGQQTDGMQTAYGEAATRNNLKQIGIAFHNFHDAYGKFPGTSNALEGARPVGGKKVFPFSWRVAILPFIEQLDLFEQYRFDEPWDSEHNLTLLDKMPEVYRSPRMSDKNWQPGHANYLGFAGENTALGTGGGVPIRDFTDGTSNTLLVMEVLDPTQTVPWTKPADVPYDGSYMGRGLPVYYLAADGAVHQLDVSDLPRFHEVITRDDRKVPASRSRDLPEVNETPRVPRAR